MMSGTGMKSSERRRLLERQQEAWDRVCELEALLQWIHCELERLPHSSEAIRNGVSRIEGEIEKHVEIPDYCEPDREGDFHGEWD